MSSRSSSRKPEPKGERVQKVLANAGLASRREIDRLIQSGRVLIDGRPAIPGDRLHGREKVLVDGRPIRLPASTQETRGEVLAYHKPAGEISSRRDPDRRRTVFESLPKPPRGRWIAIGRLDINTSGLLLFTTDGDLAHRLMHPSFEVEREYAVRIRGQLSDEQAAALRRGVRLEDGPARFDELNPMGAGRANSWYQVRLGEGRYREVRRMFEAVGATVGRLIRIRYGPVSLGRMARGTWRLLDDREREKLYAAVGYENDARRA
jgi:23S rRNA pseudouridine2605 synthase